MQDARQQQQPQQPHEIVIVRHRRDPESDEPKTGVWKIAHADFMTAMMAFFLVMWLINATDQETREVVATYFNPIRLAEATSDRKGLRDPDASSSGVDLEQRSKAPILDPDADADPIAEPRTRRFSEAALFQDPYAVLAELAAQAPMPALSPAAAIDVTPGIAGDPGLFGGEAYRDPFDPIYWQLAGEPRIGRANGDGTGGPLGIPDAAAPLGLAEPAPPQVAEARVEIAEEIAEEVVAELATQVTAAETVEIADASVEVETTQEGGALDVVATGVVAVEAEAQTAEVQAQTAETPDPALVRAAELRARIAAVVAAAVGTGRGTQAPALDVTATPEGLLVSLTDDADFGMFAVGSAEPKPQVVRILEEVAAILAREDGGIVIRGHTDARPFRSRDYDNWRLSTARAHMAYYMLVRGGLAEERILRVEGHADRMLKLADDPLADQNRRIEILIRETRT